MKNSEYWKHRFALLEEAQHKDSWKVQEALQTQYSKAQKEIENKLRVWYQRFADNNQIGLADARKMLAASELAELKWDLREYIQYGKENAINPIWIKQLENASAKFHISKLEALKLQTQQSMEVLFGNQLDQVDALAKNTYTKGYYHTAFEIQKGFGVGWDISAIDQNKLEKIISKPWAADGKNFSDRIWQNKTKLTNGLHTELTQMCILGKAPDDAIKSIAKQMNTSKVNAGRLVMTESAYFASASQKDAFNALDVEAFEVIATLDSHTSAICQEMDGKHFPMKDFEPGVTAPPFHVWCRSTTVPFFDDEWSTGERAARGKDGKTYYVPDDMKYEDWKKSLASGGNKDGLTLRESNTIIGLSNNEAWALNEYISSGSYKMNEPLRQGVPLTEEQQELVKQLDFVLSKMPVYEGVTYRSLDSSMIPDLNAFWEQHTPGKFVSYSQYTSTGAVVYDETMDIQMVIEGKSGRDIRAYNSGESEILYPRNSRFIVWKREGNKLWLKEY